MKFTAHQFLDVGEFTIAQNLSDATANGTGIDMRGFSELLAVLVNGTLGGTSPTLDVILQEDDAVGGSYTAITGAVFAQITSAAAIAFGRVDLIGRKRFIRPRATITGTSPTGEFAVAFIRIQNSGELPVTGTAAFNVGA